MGYCERCGGRYDFEDICEGCGTDEEWSWNTPENTNKVKCKHCGYDIYEVRRYCHICGTKNEAAFKKGDNYCPKCGNAFENGICPNCGKTYDFFKNRKFEPIDLRYCTECGEKTSRNDCFCLNCGNENYINKPSEIPVRISAKIKPKTGSKPAGYKNEFIDEDEDSEPIELNTTLWIILGILSSFFCCLITGIITTVLAIKASFHKSKGRYYLAAEKLEKAQGWFVLTLIIGVIEIVLGIIAAIILK